MFRKVLLVLMVMLGCVVAGAVEYEFDTSVEVFERGEKARLAVDRFGRFYAVAQDIQATTSTIRYAYSTDFSLTGWNALRNVISASDVYSSPDVIVDDAGMVHVTFSHTPSAGYDLAYYRNARSFDESFSASSGVSTTTPPTAYVGKAHRHDILVEEKNGILTAYVFTKAVTSGLLNWNKAVITDYGPGAWGDVATVSLATNTFIGDYTAACKNISGDESSNLYATWIYGNDVYFDKYISSAWGTDVTVSATAAKATNVDIAAGDDNWDTDSNDDLVVVWSDARNGYSQIYADWSRDGGTTWQTDIQVLGTATRYYDQDSPSVTMGPEDGKVHLTWRDMRHGTSSIYYIQGIYSATGISWGLDADEDGVMDTGEVDDVLQVDDDEHDAVQKDPTIAVDRYGNVVCAWQDTFTGNIRSATLLYNVD